MLHEPQEFAQGDKGMYGLSTGGTRPGAAPESLTQA
ncbi:hypothetical protein BCh11DRAFT_05819 [Burkholderia sp. Ch1-1]|nr:hypothetical protein BCh11DRAFT_05819 [Burkholderia sp. Ch1-1]